MSNRRIDPRTIAAQALGHVEPITRALVPPVHVSSTFERDADGGYSSGRGYSRPHNPSYDTPEELLAQLEGGAQCILLASGMAAATSVFQSLFPGDHIVAPRVMYWALRKWLTDFALPWGLQVEFVDTRERDAIERAMRPGQTRLLWLETPANPTWEMSDIASAADIAHRVGARLVVDSTVATPVLTRPFEFGADLVVHSATKYLNGHSDVLAGAIVTAEEDAFWHRIRAWRRDAGGILGPFEAWLLLRGMRTLFLRVERSSSNALAIARHFEGHHALSHVLYPGLESHPQHKLAQAQMQGGFGGMLSIRLAAGEAAAMRVAAQVSVFKRATSLGGVESLIEHRASIEGPSTPVPSDLLRLSVGIESEHDLIDDLEQALESVRGQSSVPVVTPRLPTVSEDDDIARQVNVLLEQQIVSLVRERGGDIALTKIDDGVAHLEYSGSPSASIAIEADIRNLLCHYLDVIHDVELSGPSTQTKLADSSASLGERVQNVIETQVNPAIASHGGAIRLLALKGHTAHVTMEGGCQGCAMAEVTLRQGVAVLIRRALPEIVAVVDDTDHSSGLTPYFKTRKG